MPRIIMNRGFIARWTRMPHSIGRLSASASSHRSLSSAAFITNIAESDFRHEQDALVDDDADVDGARAALVQSLEQFQMGGKNSYAAPDKLDRRALINIDSPTNAAKERPDE